MRSYIPMSVKAECVRLLGENKSPKEIYEDYFKAEIESPCQFESFKRRLREWKQKPQADTYTLNAGTYKGFLPHDATVRVNGEGEVVEAWIKQRAAEYDVEAFLEGIKQHVEPYDYQIPMSAVLANQQVGYNMLEIPLFDMHWGVAKLYDYQETLDEILQIMSAHRWAQIVIPFGQDFFHNDSIVKGETTKGTKIEKVDMQRAVKEAKQFIYAIIDLAIEVSSEVKVIYTPGNHDQSISWMFMQVLLERYGEEIVDDSMAYRKCFTFGANAIMVTHGQAKKSSTAKSLAPLFPIAFPLEFANATTREIHAGHLHHEEADTCGAMVRRLSSAVPTDDWTDLEDFIGANKRFMLFEWSPKKLRSIHYI